MCGISGFTHGPEGIREPVSVIRMMTSMLSHRGPDYQDIYSDNNIYLGHARLSIIDLEVVANQPMQSSDGRYVIVYNGEIYNYKELKKEITGQSSSFKSKSDTEVILETCVQYGVKKAISKFNGMFAFALWDKNDKKLYLVRDRLGIKPLYYGFQAGEIIFSSELEPIAKYFSDKTININSLSSFLRYGYVPSSQAIYNNIYKLPAGTILTYENNTHSIDKYWDLNDFSFNFPDSQLQYDEIEHQLDNLLLDSVKSRLISDVPIGAFLSGGIDSTLICAMMQKVSGHSINTYTMGFDDKQYNEASYARKIAEYLGTKHHEMTITEQNVLDIIPELPVVYDEPFSDSSQIPTTLLSKLTRNHVKVALSGDGGDEIFLGYNRYIWGNKIWSLNNDYPKIVSDILKNLTGMLSEKAWDSVSKIIPNAPLHLGLQMSRLNNVLSIRDKEIFYNKIQNQWHSPDELINHELLLQQNANHDLNELDIVEYMQLSDIQRYLPDDILVKIDRASMSVGLEVRVPLLDYRIVEYSRKIPKKYKVDNGKGKLILQKILTKYVPEKLWDRPKKGFNVPLDRWLKGPLQEWAEHLLSIDSLQKNNLFNPKPIRYAWEQHKKGAMNNSSKLWTILMFQAWIQHHETMGTHSV